MILLLYNSLIKVPKTLRVEAPSFAEYAHLNSTYSQTLTCPCSKISINYGKFLHIDYTLHQICTSTFVDESWIDYLNKQTHDIIYTHDFRVIGQFAFQALSTFCDLINQTVSDGLIQFDSNQYVSASVVPQNSFESEIESLVDKFRSSLTNSFRLSLEMIRDTTQANALFSALTTNYDLNRENVHNFMIPVPMNYDDCNCASSFACKSLLSIYKYPSDKSLFDVPNFYRGCYVVESLLQSTLECFYDKQCLDKIRSYFSSSPSMNVILLNSSLSNKYSMNSTIKTLVDNLMIEEWNTTTIFENYYNECQPIQCTYSFAKRHDLIYIVTTLFGIAGGLTTVLELVLPRLVKFLRKKKEQQQQTATGKLKARTPQYCFDL